MVTIQSQNFGVEIEMTGVSRGTAASVIANYFGVGGIHFAGGTYQTYEAKDSKGRVWKCMRDGSITPRRRRGGAIVEADDTYRCEVVTPILQYEDITDLQEVIRALVKKGAMANSSCGIHVHVDGANHTPESLCRLLNFATGRQDLFYEALQIGSRADHWRCGFFPLQQHPVSRNQPPCILHKGHRGVPAVQRNHPRRAHQSIRSVLLGNERMGYQL